MVLRFTTLRFYYIGECYYFISSEKGGELFGVGAWKSAFGYTWKAFVSGISGQG